MYDLSSNNPNPIISYDGVNKNIASVGFHEDGRWMYTGGEDCTARIWDLRCGAVGRRGPLLGVCGRGQPGDRLGSGASKQRLRWASREGSVLRAVTKAGWGRGETTQMSLASALHHTELWSTNCIQSRREAGPPLGVPDAEST